jgi:hypothetical protein
VSVPAWITDVDEDDNSCAEYGHDYEYEDAYLTNGEIGAILVCMYCGHEDDEE